MTNLTKKSSVAARAAAATAVDAVLTHGRNLDDALVKAGVQSGEAASQAMMDYGVYSIFVASA